VIAFVLHVYIARSARQSRSSLVTGFGGASRHARSVMAADKHCEGVPRIMRGIFERSGRLRSNTAIDSRRPYPACRLCRPYGANIKRHGFAV